MVQTKQGAQKAVQTILERDPDHYKKIGRLGGQKSRGYEFAHGRVDPAEAGRKGGTISRRRPAINVEYKEIEDEDSNK